MQTYKGGVEMRQKNPMTSEQRMALECYLQHPAIVESLLTEGYVKEEEFRKANQLLTIRDAEELELYIEHAIVLYTLLMQQSEKELVLPTPVYTILRAEQWKTWMLQAENTSFLVASTVPIEHTNNVVLLSITLEKGVPYVLLYDLLGDAYAHYILIAPFCQIEEVKIAKGTLPKKIVMRKPVLKSVSTETMQELRKRVLQNFKTIKTILDKIGREPLSRQEILLYANWKRTLLSYVRARMKQANAI